MLYVLYLLTYAHVAGSTLFVCMYMRYINFCAIEQGYIGTGDNSDGDNDGDNDGDSGGDDGGDGGCDVGDSDGDSNDSG